MLYVPVNNFSVMSGRFTKQRIKCLSQGHNIVPLVSLELSVNDFDLSIIVINEKFAEYSKEDSP